MAAIDLLFDVKSNSERLHQLALGSILIKTQILSKMGIISKPKGNDFGWEPKGGLFDLSVELENGEVVWFKIKIDSDLNNRQLERQLNFALNDPDNKDDHLFYLLLGFSQYFHNPSELQKHLDQKKGSHAGVLKVITSQDFIGFLEDSTILPDTKIKSRDTRDLIVAYRDSLKNLQLRAQGYSYKNINSWKDGDYFGFFSDCQNNIPAMKNAGMGSVPNPSGGFMGCWWGFKKVSKYPTAEIYLQFENDKLCFKVFVESETERSKIRNEISHRLIENGKKSPLNIKRPRRLGYGEYLTVALLDDNPLEEGIDWEKLKRCIGLCEDLIQEVANSQD